MFSAGSTPAEGAMKYDWNGNRKRLPKGIKKRDREPGITPEFATWGPGHLVRAESRLSAMKAKRKSRWKKRCNVHGYHIGYGKEGSR